MCKRSAGIARLAAAAAVVIAVVPVAVVAAAAVAEQQDQDDDPPAVIATEAVVVPHKEYLQKFFVAAEPLIPRYSGGHKMCSALSKNSPVVRCSCKGYVPFEKL